MRKTLEQVLEEIRINHKVSTKKYSDANEIKPSSFSYPWENLSEEDLKLFKEKVKKEVNDEQYKEKDIRSYLEIKMEVWNNWQKKGK